MAGNPWDNDPIVGTAGIGRPVIRKGVDPSKPEFIPGSPGQIYDPKTGGAQDIPGFKPKPDASKTTYRDMTPDEKAAHHLSADAPWLLASDGSFKLPEGYKPADDASKDAIQKQENLDAADSLINGVRRARGFIGDAIDIPLLGNTATGGGYNVLRHSPFPTDASKLEGVINQEIRGNIFMKRIADLKAANDSPNGGTGIGRIMQAEIPLITGAIGTLDPGKLGKAETLKSLDQIERAALRSKAIFNGENPDDPQVQHKYGITAVAAAQAGPPPTDVNPIANGGDGDQGPTLGPSGGNTRSVVDPQKQAFAEKIAALVSKGADRNTVMGFAVRGDPTLRDDPEFRGWVDDALKFRQQHPNAKFPIDPGFYTSEVPLSGQEKAGNAVAQSGAGAAIMNAGNAVTAGNMGNLTGDKEGVDRALAVADAQHPTASLAGSVAGGATAALGLEGLLGRLGMVPGLGRVALADTGYGATAGATNAPEGQGLEGATKGGLAALLGSLGGNMAARGAGSVVRGVTNPTVSYVAKDIPLTIGQAVSQSGTVGKMVKGLEDRVAGLPIVGDAINARRLEGLQRMNAKAFDRALEPINETAGGQFGEQAVAHAQDKVSSAFTKALAGKSAGLDHGFIVEAEKGKMAIDGLPDRVRSEVNDSVDEVVNNYFDDSGQISGENMQALLRDLGGIKRGYRNDPLGNRIGKAVDQISGSVENLFRRQAPDVMPQYDAAKKAFKRVSTLEDAVLRAKNTNGVFTPGQLGLSDRANTIKYGGKHTAAAGGGEFHDFQRNMQEVLPNKVPDSGTAGRLLIPGALIAGGAGAGAAGGDAEKGLTLGALLAMAYSRAGQRVLTGAALKRGSAAKTAGAAIRKAGPLLGHAASQAALGTTRD